MSDSDNPRKVHMGRSCKVIRIEPSAKWGSEVTIKVGDKSVIVLGMHTPSFYGLAVGSEVQIDIKWEVQKPGP